MGQAKNRGSFEERKAEAIENKRALDSLNAWLKARQPTRKKKRRISASALAFCTISSGVIPIYPAEEIVRRRR